ncbi:MAG: stage III sporulation protein AB [Clostridia bacterium]|nr:stage III sporulation protein AB [Clostridia bacterium]
MVRLLGAAAVLASSVLTGGVMAKELDERVKLLRQTQDAAVFIKSELMYRAPVFEECFRGRGKIFSAAARYIKEGQSPTEALERAASEVGRLTKGDREILTEYARGLCAEEVGGQTANVSLLITRLEAAVREAEAERQAKGRLYRSGGVLAGLAFVIMLI